MTPIWRLTGLLFRLFGLGALLLSAGIACSKDDGAAQPTPTPLAASEDVSQYRGRLGADFWASAEDADWLDGDRATPDGARLLQVIAASGPLVNQERRLALLGAYPGGLGEETLSIATQYARLTIRDLYDVLDAPWLLDGVDDYEGAVLDAAAERVISASALKLAIEQRFFEDLFDADPALLTSRRIDALGSLNPTILARAQQEPWFQDGLDDYDVSLLGILAEEVQVEDALEVLDQRTYRPLRLQDTTVAVVFQGDSQQLQREALELVQAWILDVEAFVGEFQSIGLIIDVTPVPGDPFCHGAGGSEYSVGAISFTSDGCFHDEVVVHELAHAFIGGRYPAWFTEGIAELVTYHVYGHAAGYGGGSGDIDLEGYYFVGSSIYINQASLGADFLIELYDLAGPRTMSAFTREVAGQRLGGQNLLTRIRALDGVNLATLAELIQDYVGPLLPPPSSGVPAATPPSTSR
jgi:hypothetical protein